MVVVYSVLYHCPILQAYSSITSGTILHFYKYSLVATVYSVTCLLDVASEMCELFSPA